MNVYQVIDHDVVPVYSEIPRVEVNILVGDNRMCVYSLDVSRPRIDICEGLVRAVAAGEAVDAYDWYQEEATDIEDNAGALERAFATHFRAALLQLDEYSQEIEVQEAFYFILAHELVHIWLGETGAGSLDSELRADAYGLLFAAEISAAQRRKAQLEARFYRTMRIQLSDPFDIALISSDFGALVALGVYEKYCINNLCNSNEDNYLPSSERADRISEAVQRIISAQAAQRSAVDVELEILRSNLISSLLGFQNSEF